MKIEQFIAKLDRVKKSSNGYQCRCPAHKDNRSSLSVSTGKDGRIILKCHARCSVKTIVNALFLEEKDLFADQVPQVGKSITYDYTNAKGNLIYQVEKTPDKHFFHRRKKNGRWIYKGKKIGVDKKGEPIYEGVMDGITRVLYHLPEVIGSDYVYIVEGEKDVETLRAVGKVATCNSGGAGKGKWLKEFNDYFTSKTTIILPDNDKAGKEHALTVANELKNVAKLIKVVNLSGLKEKGDVSDYLKTHSKDELLKEVEKAEEWTGELPPPFKLIHMSTDPPMPVEWLIPSFIPKNSKMIIGAEQKVGKTFLTFYLSICVVTGEPFFGAVPKAAGDVIIYSAEGENNVKQRFYGLCVAMGIDFNDIVNHIHFVNKKQLDFNNPENISAMNKFVKDLNVKMVSIDPLVSASLGIDENSTVEMHPLLLSLQKITDSNPDCCLVICHHEGKSQGDKSQGHRLRGSTAVSGWYDGLISLERNKKEKSTRSMSFNFRDAPDRLSIHWTLNAEPLPTGLQDDLRESGFYKKPEKILELRQYSIVTVAAPEKEDKITCRLDPLRVAKIIVCIINSSGALSRSACAMACGMPKATSTRYFNWLLENKVVAIDVNGWLKIISSGST